MNRGFSSCESVEQVNNNRSVLWGKLGCLLSVDVFYVEAMPHSGGIGKLQYAHSMSLQLHCVADGMMLNGSLL